MTGRLFDRYAQRNKRPNTRWQILAESKGGFARKRHELERNTMSRRTEMAYKAQEKPENRKLVPPGHQNPGKPEKSHKIEVKLAGPGHIGNICKEDWQQVPAVLASNHKGVNAQTYKNHDEVETKQFHESP
jgi:hypothetical protein